MIRSSFLLTPTRSSRRGRRPASKRQVSVLQVDQRVWSKALELAEGQCRRLEVRSATEVVVRNQ